MVAITPHLTRLIAGIPVPNTPLINASISLARASMPDHGFNHVMRAWLNGQAIINHLPPHNRSQIDVEAFGVAAILHDMGWAFNTSFISTNKIFEVDGANAARDFIRAEGGEGWNEHRIQLVWDSIALHTYVDVAQYKQPEVAITSGGTYTELVGVELGKAAFGDLITVNQTEYDAISTVYPRSGLLGYLNETSIELCKLKPAATYLNFVGDWGEKYVPGYTKVGHRVIDLLESALPAEKRAN
ncbi:hypothetical protein DM02DRAFT_698415 [Periconia macrospinosa]|uniref:HD domain-containing protein n=1 Tax=Periconia macrospinosa TaxID=97972 RepID=A0A2V1D435_9PLEO|nr:hypothetical protein DM02DRAFT_698415 [Periconia macrospinosa]